MRGKILRTERKSSFHTHTNIYSWNIIGKWLERKSFSTFVECILQYSSNPNFIRWSMQKSLQWKKLKHIPSLFYTLFAETHYWKITICRDQNKAHYQIRQQKKYNKISFIIITDPFSLMKMMMNLKDLEEKARWVTTSTSHFILSMYFYRCS